MSGELGKASLDLEADLTNFERKMAGGRRSAEGMEHTLESLAAISNVAERALNEVGLSPGKAAESRISAEGILSGVRGISEESRAAALEIDRVKLSEAQASETEAAALRMDRSLDGVGRNADQARRKLEEVRLAGGRNGVGVGPFGSGFGRVGLLGSAIGVGALAAPAAAPAAIGLLAAIPGLALAGAGALGTLALAFGGVGKAISGDKKAFDDLGPAAQQFVLTIRSLDGWFDKLKQTAAKGLFPGLTAGLHAALSPGTVSVLERAVSALAKALGAVGAEFGRYFGSSEFQKIFGPLMQSAARNIRVMGDAALHLFDALGVLARAAIPFTNWLASAADKGAKLFDSWIHGKDASGQLSHGMDEARKSLTLVAKLFEALLKAAFALGQALYPISKVAIKALTDGLNGLAGIIHRNQGAIREIVGGALKLLIGAVHVAVDGVKLFVGALHAIGGHKAAVIAAITAIGIVIAATLGPEAAVIIGAIAAVGYIRNHWQKVVGFYKTIGHEIVNAFKYVWYLIEKGALIAALKVVEPFSHLPSFLGGWARKAKNSMQHQLDKVHAPNMNWSDIAAKDGAVTGAAWRRAFEEQTAKNQKALQKQALNAPPIPFSFWLREHPGGTHKQYEAFVRAYEQGQKIAKEDQRRRHRRRDQSSATDTSSMPTDTSSPFGKDPPFTKNTGTSGSGSGSRSPIPQSALNLEALASRQDQQAAALGYAGKAARFHLDKEIVDLQKADKILEEKLKNAHGARRRELYKAITENLKKIAEARKRLREALTKARQDQLNFALDQAKLAVENAKEGSKAWDRAISEEEKALQAEIRYWDKRAHNDKLSKDARDAALRKELSYEKQLKSLMTATSQAAVANEKQFIQTYLDIQNTFGDNATPIPPAGNAKTNSHLYEIKNEARKTNRHLQAMRSGARFPASDQAYDAAMAVTG